MKKEATIEHCVFCFDVLVAALERRELPVPKFTHPSFDSPVFVTFHMNQEELKGCIGTFQPGPLGKQLTNFTLSAAFKDDRFEPIKKQDLKALDIGVSLLVNF